MRPPLRHLPSFLPHARGLSVIEQLMTLVVLSVLAMVALPALGRWTALRQLDTAQRDFLAALNHARGLALHERSPTLLCPSRDGEQCSDDKTAWSAGWLIGHADDSRPGQLQGEAVFRHEAYGPRLSVEGNGARPYVRFEADGSTGQVSNQSLFLCMRDRPDQVLALRIARLGRVRGETIANHQGFDCPSDADP